MILKTCISVAIVLVTVVNAFKESTTCPDFQLKCPPCGEDETCVYPNSGGCEGAGIPICKTNKCDKMLCLTLRQPCPEECPFSCTYDGPPCCPFNGPATCAPVCNTFVACKETPCPDDCPGNCHYPEAGSCCPHSGEAVCNAPAIATHDKRVESSAHRHAYASAPWGISYSSDVENRIHSAIEEQEANGWGYDLNGVHHTCVSGDPNCRYGAPLHFEQDCEISYRHYDGDGDSYEGLFIGGLNPVRAHRCKECTDTVTDIDITLKFVTTTVSSDDIFCAQSIIPCPSECPYDCIYPMDQPCPFTQEPWCPIYQPPIEEECDTIYATDGYPFPYFPSSDPYYDQFMTIMNSSGVTSTPTFDTAIVTEPSVHMCPMIFKYCPVECPDSCLRPDVPCPFAVDGYCPGSAPTTTDSEAAVVTPTANTVVGGALMCPMYMLACPICPDGYECSRDTTGHCPNTNQPYCVSTIVTGAPASLMNNYASAQKYDLHAQSSPDKCALAGLVKIPSKKVLDQLQEHHVDCHNCPELKWDKSCGNTCSFRTQDNCCIQTLCLPH